MTTLRTLPRSISCFACGAENRSGLKLQFHTDGGHVEAQFSFRPEHSGFRRVVHGGLVATALDEAMAWACGVQTKQFAFCAELTVRFLSPVPTEQPLVLRAAVEQNRKNRIIELAASLEDGAGKLLAEASGKYIPLKADQMREALQDFAPADAAAIFR